MHAPTGLNYRCNYSIKDLASNVRCDDEILLKKDGTKGEQYFLVSNPSGVWFNPFASSNDSLRFQYYDTSNRTLYVKYYVPLFGPALPAFSNAEKQNVVIQADSVFTWQSGEYISFFQEGVYKTISQKSDTAGIIVLRFHPDYPAVSQPGHLIFPLRYITMNVEYDHLMNDTNPKLAVDSLWLRISGFNKEIAKQLISTFYNRVQDANLWFTTYKEGWMTDRGMILIVYGRPDHVFREIGKEVWTYNGNYDEQPVSFTFQKNENSFSSNDFVLQRNYFFLSSWNLQIYRWRHGLIDEL